MSSLEITQRTEFSCCYVLPESPHNSTSNLKLYAFNYKFEATVECDENLAATGRVLSFEEFLKQCKLSVPDKSFVYNYNTSNVYERDLAHNFSSGGIETFPLNGPVSAEELLNKISLILVGRLRSDHPEVVLVETKLRETPNSFVTWKRER